MNDTAGWSETSENFMFSRNVSIDATVSSFSLPDFDFLSVNENHTL